MKTERQMSLYYFSWVLLTVLFNIVVFAVTNAEKRSTVIYWISYAVIMVVLIAELIFTARAGKVQLEGKYRYRIPLIKACMQFLIFTIVAGTLFLSVPAMPSWLGMVLCAAFGAMNVSLIRNAQSSAPEGKEIAMELEASLEAQRAARNAQKEARRSEKEARYSAARAEREEKKKAEEAAAREEAAQPKYVKYGSDKKRK